VQFENERNLCFQIASNMVVFLKKKKKEEEERMHDLKVKLRF